MEEKTKQKRGRNGVGGKLKTTLNVGNVSKN